jgi:hypothetical protein
MCDWAAASQALIRELSSLWTSIIVIPPSLNSA